MSESRVMAQRRIKQGLGIALRRRDDKRVVELCRSYKSQGFISREMGYGAEFSLGKSAARVLVHHIIKKSDLISEEEYGRIRHSVVSYGAISTLVKRGCIPWSPGENMFAYVLHKSGVYTHKEIGEILGKVLGKVRPEGSVRNHVYEFKQKYRNLKEAVESFS